MDATDQKHAINTKSARPKVVIGEVEGILFVVFVNGVIYIFLVKMCELIRLVSSIIVLHILHL